MKLALFLITVLICTPSIAQVEVNKNLETNNSSHAALCETKISEDAEVITIPGILDDIITVLPKGTKVSVFTTVDGYWLIKTSEIEGYINEKYLKVTNKMKRGKNNDNAQENSKINDVRIKENQVWIGMTKATVRENIGEPIGYSIWTNYQGAQTEIWKYDNKSLYFENGIFVRQIY